jgi:hypothetical protein
MKNKNIKPHKDSHFFVSESDSFFYGFVEQNSELKPTKVIVNRSTVICFFEDGDKVVVTCHEDDNFSIENGIAACIAKKVFGSWSNLVRFSQSEKVQTQVNKEYLAMYKEMIKMTRKIK